VEYSPDAASQFCGGALRHLSADRKICGGGFSSDFSGVLGHPRQSILPGKAVGISPEIGAASDSMVRIRKTYVPDPEAHRSMGRNMKNISSFDSLSPLFEKDTQS
jgi:hypothetical protein